MRLFAALTLAFAPRHLSNAALDMSKGLAHGSPFQLDISLFMHVKLACFDGQDFSGPLVNHSSQNPQITPPLQLLDSSSVLSALCMPFSPRCGQQNLKFPSSPSSHIAISLRRFCSIHLSCSRCRRRSFQTLNACRAIKNARALTAVRLFALFFAAAVRHFDSACRANSCSDDSRNNKARSVCRF